MALILMVVGIMGILSVQAEEFSLQVLLRGYGGFANLTIKGDNFSSVEEVKNGSVLHLPQGNYSLRLTALNKTFVETVKLHNNTTVTFNLLFTSSPENLRVVRHIIIQPSLEVFEIILITNPGEENFEGDLRIPLPSYRDLGISDSTLSFLDVFEENGSLIFDSIIVPANGSGQVSIYYTLTTLEFSLKSEENQSLLILTTLPVLEYSNLNFTGIQKFGGVSYKVYEGDSASCMLKFKRQTEVNLGLESVAAVLLSSAILFLYLYGRRGGWED